MNDFSKNRVLALYKILTTYTDEQHQISIPCRESNCVWDIGNC